MTVWDSMNSLPENLQEVEVAVLPLIWENLRRAKAIWLCSQQLEAVRNFPVLSW